MGLALFVQEMRSNQLVNQHQFDADAVRTVKIGRLNSAQLKLDDPGASRIHAVIELTGGVASLVDMGTTSGTTVNGEKVSKVKLNHGDQIGIGSTILVVGLGQPALAAQAAPAAQPAAMPGQAPMMAAGGMVQAAGGAMGAPAMPGQMPPQMGGPMVGQMAPQVAPAQTMPGQVMPGQMPAAQMPVAQMPGAQMPGAQVPVAQMPAPNVAPGLMAGAAAAMPGAMPGQMPSPMASPAPGQFAGEAQTPTPAGGLQPRFDGGAQAPQRRATRDRVFSAAVESRPHPSLPPEPPLSNDNRVLEMRAYWGEVLLGVYHYIQPKRITLGEAKGTDFFISSEGLPIEVFPFVRYIDGQYVLTFTKQMDGEIEIDGQAHPLETLRGSSLARKDGDLEDSYQVNLAMETRALVHWGGATFALRFVPPAKPPAKALFEGMDLHYVNTLVLSLFFHIAMVATMMWYPYDTAALRVDLFDEDAGRFANIVLEGPTQNKSTEDLLAKLKKQVEEKKEKIKPPPELNVVDRSTSKVKNQPRVKTQAERSAEVKQRFSKMFSSGSGSGSGALLGGGGGGTLSGTLSNVIGTAGKGSSSAGLAGLGIRGTGPMTGGGIGTSRGIAGIGTSGRAGGGGLAYGSGIGIGKKADRGMISLSTPVVMGALPKEAIQKVINQNRAQVRYCYEVELQRNQNLEGRIMMSWVIAATGSVAKVKVANSSMNNAAVERCIAAKIKTWKFPAPSGGGIVEVNYPFVFRAG